MNFFSVYQIGLGNGIHEGKVTPHVFIPHYHGPHNPAPGPTVTLSALNGFNIRAGFNCCKLLIASFSDWNGIVRRLNRNVLLTPVILIDFLFYLNSFRESLSQNLNCFNNQFLQNLGGRLDFMNQGGHLAGETADIIFFIGRDKTGQQG